MKLLLGDLGDYDARVAAGEQLPREEGRAPQSEVLLDPHFLPVRELLDQVTRLRALLEEHMGLVSNGNTWGYCMGCDAWLHEVPGAPAQPHLADCILSRTRAELGEKQQEGK
ncbi:hypothetical protein LCGC14_1494840 [marine sediment metagenome]|uniref:Uncharacterized protein n=1 Tax=marine sediment metagenome TaxID=412755 RepID=A0A0F9LL75_9ZZZZ